MMAKSVVVYTAIEDSCIRQEDGYTRRENAKTIRSCYSITCLPLLSLEKPTKQNGHNSRKKDVSTWCEISSRSTELCKAMTKEALMTCSCDLSAGQRNWRWKLVWGPEQPVGSVLGLLSCLMHRHGFHPPMRRIFLVEGIFHLELTWVLTPLPQNSFGRKYKPRSSLCTHAFHRTDSKDPDIHVRDEWMPATKAHPACTIHKDGMRLPQWLD